MIFGSSTKRKLQKIKHKQNTKEKIMQKCIQKLLIIFVTCDIRIHANYTYTDDRIAPLDGLRTSLVGAGGALGLQARSTSV